MLSVPCRPEPGCKAALLGGGQRCTMHVAQSAPVIGIVDGHDDLVGLMRMVLELEGFRVITASSRAAAEPSGAWRRPGLIRPHLLIRNLSPSARVPIAENWRDWGSDGPFAPAVLYTSSEPEMITSLLGPDAEGNVIPLPFDIDQLVERVNRALQRQEQQKEKVSICKELAASLY